jgi:hypothetical protein
MSSSEWLITLGQCLVCGGRGGWAGPGAGTTLCPRCGGSGRDPDRASDWYMDVVLPVQVEAVAAQRLM